MRPLEASDIDTLINIDHSYHTDHVWQMELEQGEERVAVAFRQIRLPRSMMVEYPRDTVLMGEGWKEKAAIFVAEDEEEPVGYLVLTVGESAGTARVTDLAVLRRLRKHGIGSSLVRKALQWAFDNGYKAIKS